MTETPPRGLEWTIAPFGRVLALSLALVSLGLSIFFGFKQNQLIDCLAAQDLADQRRTSAIASATDAERVADLENLLKATAETKQDLIAARRYSDRVRAANPAPDVEPCG